jgi:hypothetical protein
MGEGLSSLSKTPHPAGPSSLFQDPEATAAKIFNQGIWDAKKDVDASLQRFKDDPSVQNTIKLESTLDNLDKQIASYRTNLKMVKNLNSFLDSLRNIA